MEHVSHPPRTTPASSTQRLLTAAVGTPIIAACILLLNGPWFFLFVAIIFTWAALEYEEEEPWTIEQQDAQWSMVLPLRGDHLHLGRPRVRRDRAPAGAARAAGGAGGAGSPGGAGDDLVPRSGARAAAAAGARRPDLGRHRQHGAARPHAARRDHGEPRHPRLRPAVLRGAAGQHLPPAAPGPRPGLPAARDRLAGRHRGLLRRQPLRPPQDGARSE